MEVVSGLMSQNRWWKYAISTEWNAAWEKSINKYNNNCLSHCWYFSTPFLLVFCLRKQTKIFSFVTLMVSFCISSQWFFFHSPPAVSSIFYMFWFFVWVENNVMWVFHCKSLPAFSILVAKWKTTHRYVVSGTLERSFFVGVHLIFARSVNITHILQQHHQFSDAASNI